MPELHLLQHAEELVGQRSLGVAGHLRERGVEAEARLDRDDEQVERVGELALDLLGPVVGRLVEDDVRQEEAQDAPGRRRARSPTRTLPNSSGSSRPTAPPMSSPSILKARMRSVSQPGRVAGEVELAAHARCLVARGEASTEAGEPADERAGDALVERAVEVAAHRRRGRVDRLDGGERARDAAGSVAADDARRDDPDDAEEHGGEAGAEDPAVPWSDLHLDDLAEPERAADDEQDTPTTIMTMPSGVVMSRPTYSGRTRIR